MGTKNSTNNKKVSTDDCYKRIILSNVSEIGYTHFPYKLKPYTLQNKVYNNSIEDG